MSKYSIGVPVSLGALYAIQDKFFPLRILMIMVSAFIGYLVFVQGKEISEWGFLGVAVLIAFIIYKINKIKKSDMALYGDTDIDWLNFSQDGSISYAIGKTNTVDDNYQNVKFTIYHSDLIQSVASFIPRVEKIHTICMDVQTSNKSVPPGKKVFTYYSRRAFILPYIYELCQMKKNSKVDFIKKVKISPDILKGQDLLTLAVNKEDSKYINPPFLFNSGRITGEELGVRFVFGLSIVTVKYENLELYAYPSTLDNLVDFVLHFNERTYMFKLNLNKYPNLIK